MDKDNRMSDELFPMYYLLLNIKAHLQTFNSIILTSAQNSKFNELFKENMVEQIELLTGRYEYLETELKDIKFFYT